MENPCIRKKRRIVQRDWRPLMVLNCHNKYDKKLDRKESMATGGAWYSYWLSLRLLPLLHCGADQLTIHCLLTTHNSPPRPLTTQVENMLPINILQVSFPD